ncbi:MAG TPA: mechanosensitive ion channel domain-containing protein [Thermomicrobiales bacterium]|nr:mechanosensitive ion channel domain-containing protein [Thermomicrobiales bacterium]
MQDHLQRFLKDVGSPLGHVAEGIIQILILGAITFYLARYAGKFVGRAMARRSFGRNGALLVGRLSSVAIWIAGISAIMATLGVSSTGILTLISASTVAISLSLQDVLKNFVSGIFLLVERPFKVGDRIRVRDVVGEVQGIDIRTTLIRNTEGALVMVPNATIFTEILINRSHYRTRRLDITVTCGRNQLATINERIAAAVDGIEGVRRPLPAPTMRSATPEETIIELSLLIETSPDVEQNVIRRLIDALGDAKLEVTKP